MKFLIFEKYPKLKYGMSEKMDGAMELGRQILDGMEPKNRRAYFEMLGIPYERTVGAFFAHGTDIRIANENDAGKIIEGVDGFITKEDNLFLTVTSSDCFPVYLFDPVGKIVGLVHAGWRGVAKNIISKALEVFDGLGVSKKNLLVGIGPGIQVCHFEVKEDALNEFQKNIETEERDSKTFINLSGMIKSQLRSGGVLSENIENNGECTFCLKDKYFSYRRDKPETVQPMVAYLGMKQ